MRQRLAGSEVFAAQGLLLAIEEFLHVVDATELQDGRAHGGLEENGEVTAGSHRNGDFADGHAEDGFGLGIQWQTRRFRDAGLRFLQVYDELQFHLATAGRFAKDGADVEQTQATDFEKVAQQLRTAPFQGVL